MATKSFLKTVSLRGEKQCKDFIRALEKSKSTQEKEVILSRPASDMSREEIRKIFKAERQES